MKDSAVYCSYGDYAVVYDISLNSFSLFFECGKEIVTNARIEGLYIGGIKAADLEEYRHVDVTRVPHINQNELILTFLDGPDGFPEVTLRFIIGNDGIIIQVSNIGLYTVFIKGDIKWGSNSENDTFAMNVERTPTDLRAAIGPAASAIDNALYDRKTDSALCIGGCRKLRLAFDWDKKLYTCRIHTFNNGYQEKIRFYIKKQILSKKYGIEFAPINKNGIFSKPPAGWMTWYAVKFGACEEAVLRNTKWQMENLKMFGADTVWVDWEWCHKAFEPKRTDDVDIFNPDPEKYPRGLKYIADEIKKAGFVPALWIGFTNDLSYNKYMRENPEIVLAEKESWCGTYFYDFSHPKYLEEFLPMAIKNVRDWGFQAVKYDTLPIAMEHHEQFHMKMHNPALSTKEAYRKMIKKVRELLSDDTYMLSCAALQDSDVLWGADVFDAARVGNDVFLWEEFLEQCVEKVLRYYPLHNVVLYNDPDNVVLRDEFNTFEQALSRICFTCLLGLPMTFGDDFAVLDEKRFELMKRCLPVLDIHPMDIESALCDRRFLLLNLAIERSFESYMITDIFNMTDEAVQISLNLEYDLHLDKGQYLVFDYFVNEFYITDGEKIDVDLKPHESKVLSIRRKLNHPQIVSTSRHITQGAAEIKDLMWNDDEGTLSLSCALTANDSYDVTVYVPEGYSYAGSDFDSFTNCGKNLIRLSFMPINSTEYHFKVMFTK